MVCGSVLGVINEASEGPEDMFGPEDETVSFLSILSERFSVFFISNVALMDRYSKAENRFMLS